MTAVLIPTASETDWLDARRTGITASEIAAVMGLSPYSSPYALYHQKLGNLPGPEETDAMALGKHMESFVAGKFAERHPEFFVCGDGRSLWQRLERPWQMATPDRLITEVQCKDCGQPDCPWGHLPIAVLECKIDGGSDEWGEDGSDEIPVHYRCQVLWQMDVMGVDTGYVACLLWARRQVRVYELTIDEADLQLMRNEAALFLKSIDYGKPPEPDWRPATGAALKRLHPGLEDTEITISRTLAGQYRGACAAVRKAEQRKALAENRIRARLGDGRRVLDPSGQLVASRQVYDVKEHTRKAATVNKIVPARAKKEPSA